MMMMMVVVIMIFSTMIMRSAWRMKMIRLQALWFLAFCHEVRLVMDKHRLCVSKSIPLSNICWFFLGKLFFKSTNSQFHSTTYWENPPIPSIDLLRESEQANLGTWVPSADQWMKYMIDWFRVWRIYSNIQIFQYFWSKYLFGYSIVSFSGYEYIRIFVCFNLFGYEYIRIFVRIIFWIRIYSDIRIKIILC